MSPTSVVEASAKDVWNKGKASRICTAGPRGDPGSPAAAPLLLTIFPVKAASSNTYG